MSEAPLQDIRLAAAARRCAELIGQADGVLITAGAGMGVDSGLPDFRGPQGFWGAYPALGRARIAFEQIANPAAFTSHPQRAWGFYAHRLNLYRRTVPHEGFQILQRIGARLPQGAFVYTSNVDGQFQRSGFPEARIEECHGSIHHLQCMAGCQNDIWPATDFLPEIDQASGLLTSAFPRCPWCAGMARPNILMFGDGAWLSARQAAQGERRKIWLRRIEQLLVIEIGAGTNIPTVRMMGEKSEGMLIRINPSEAQLGAGKGVSIAVGGLAALRAIASCLA